MCYHAVFLLHGVFYNKLYVCMVLCKTPVFLLCPVTAFAVSFSEYLYQVCARVWYRLSNGSYYQNQNLVNDKETEWLVFSKVTCDFDYTKGNQR